MRGGSVSHQSKFIACYEGVLKKYERQMILHEIAPDQNGHTLSIEFYAQPIFGVDKDPFSEYEGTLKFHHHDVSFSFDRLGPAVPLPSGAPGGKVTIKGKYYTTGNKNERGGNRTRTITAGNKVLPGFDFEALKEALQAKVAKLTKELPSKDELARMVHNEQKMQQTHDSPSTPPEYREWSSGTHPTTSELIGGPSVMAFVPPQPEGNPETGHYQ